MWFKQIPHILHHSHRFDSRNYLSVQYARVFKMKWSTVTKHTPKCIIDFLIECHLKWHRLHPLPIKRAWNFLNSTFFHLLPRVEGTSHKFHTFSLILDMKRHIKSILIWDKSNVFRDGDGHSFLLRTPSPN